MIKRKLLAVLSLPCSIVLLPTFIASCNKNVEASPLVKPTTEEMTKTIENGKKNVDYVFNFNKKIVSDDFEFHIEEEARDLISIQERILDASGKQVTLKIGYFDTKLPTVKTTLNFKLEFNYIANAEWKTETIDCILVYKPQSIECNVNFIIMDKGTQTQYATKKVKINSLVDEPEKPTTQGATFRGWFKDSKFTEKWDFAKDLVQKENTTIYGIYDYQLLTVNYDENGGTWSKGTTPPVQKVYYGNTTSDPCEESTPGCVPAPTKEHYRYRGWYKDTQCQEKWDFINDKVKSNMTLHVGWEPITYTVRFKAQPEGIISYDSQNVKYNCLVTQPETKTVEGYTFDGWYTSTSWSTKWDFATDTVQDDMILYCKYTKI